MFLKGSVVLYQFIILLCSTYLTKNTLHLNSNLQYFFPNRFFFKKEINSLFFISFPSPFSSKGKWKIITWYILQKITRHTINTPITFKSSYIYFPKFNKNGNISWYFKKYILIVNTVSKLNFFKIGNLRPNFNLL